MDYCLFGADWTAGARGPDREQGSGNREQTDPRYLIPDPFSPTIGLLVKARALRLPISLDDAKRMTASELQETIDRALSDDGKIDWEKTRIAAIKPLRARAQRNQEAVREGSHGSVDRTPAADAFEWIQLTRRSAMTPAMTRPTPNAKANAPSLKSASLASSPFI